MRETVVTRILQSNFVCYKLTYICCMKSMLGLFGTSIVSMSFVTLEPIYEIFSFFLEQLKIVPSSMCQLRDTSSNRALT